MTKEQKREYNRAWAKANPERKRETQRRYIERNADKIRRRQREKWAALTSDERHAIYKRQYQQYKKRIAANPKYAARRRAQACAAAKRYAASHKAEIAERNRAYRERNRERINAQAREYCGRPENTERKRRNQKLWRQSHRDEYLRSKREKRAANLEASRASERRAEARRKKRKQTDAAYYHKRLAGNRIASAKAQIAKGKMYHPRYSMRFPEWATMGVFDPRSAFLAENITPEMRAYARELARERRAAR